MNVSLTVLVIYLLRILLPIGLMALLAYLLRRSDKRWQDEAARAPKEIVEESAQETKRPIHI